METERLAEMGKSTTQWLKEIYMSELIRTGVINSRTE